MSDNDLIKRGEVRKLAAPLETEDGEILVVDMDDVDEIPAVPQEMTARELLHVERRMFGKHLDAWSEYSDYVIEGKVDEAVAYAERWAKEHPEQKRKTYQGGNHER